YPTRLCVADPEGSVFHRHHADRSVTAPPQGACCLIEGIGRPRVEPSFVPEVIDRMIAVPDAASIGAMRAIAARIGRPVGGSTGTNIHACLMLAEEMADAGQAGSIVTILCDSGLRYAQTYYDDAWLEAQKLDWKPAQSRAATLLC
ncbi:MAG: PLP-dependent cysteine synthase family protein, partial [Novosphingobium sp.]